MPGKRGKPFTMRPQCASAVRGNRGRFDKDQASNRLYQIRSASKRHSDSVHQDWRIVGGSDFSAATSASGPDSRRIQVDGTPLEIFSIWSLPSDRTTTCAAPTTAHQGVELTRVDDDNLADGRDRERTPGVTNGACYSVFLTPGAWCQAPGTPHQAPGCELVYLVTVAACATTVRAGR